MEFLSSMDSFVISFIFSTAILFLFFGIDDLFIDLCALVFRLKPEKLSMSQYRQLDQVPQKRIAILIAAWQEAGVLRQMVRGNASHLQYGHYDFFIGVYPNDDGTREEALLLQNEFPNVHVILNAIPGPTSKGQMLNELVRGVFRNEKEFGGRKYDAFLIHDSEDLIHRDALKLINSELNHSDFIQIPIFSLPVSQWNWVAGTYMDEFSEAHTKDLLVRQKLGAPIPSAGVGTALSRRLVLTYCKAQVGNLLNERSLTEDYELGTSTANFKMRSSLPCFYLEQPSGKVDYIATREYFPKSFSTSIRQKTRWTLGIAFQGTEHLGWSGSLVHKYFLYRDRKGPISNALSGLALLLFAYSLVRMVQDASYAEALTNHGQLVTLFLINALFMVNRLVQRMICAARVYGWKTAALVPIRLPIANVINAVAAFQATGQFVKSKAFGVAPRWEKTTHELPAGFGESQQEEAVSEEIKVG